MNKTLTVAFITSRHEPLFEWFLASLKKQAEVIDFDVILVDGNWSVRHDRSFPNPSPYGGLYDSFGFGIQHVPPKPNPWQGAHRLTQSDWWAKSNALNTALCMAKTDWIWTVDDRCVLSPTSLQAVREAMAGEYVMCGSYEKRHNMKVENGEVVEWGTLDGSDPRSPNGQDHRNAKANGLTKAPGSWTYGCSLALPVEWALQVNGWEENCDSCRHEDCVFGVMLENNKYPIYFDPRNKVIQDRTPGKCGPDVRSDCKERHPHDTQDKVHRILKYAKTATCSRHPLNMRQIRENFQASKGWPDVSVYGTKDWYDQMEIKDMV